MAHPEMFNKRREVEEKKLKEEERKVEQKEELEIGVNETEKKLLRAAKNDLWEVEKRFAKNLSSKENVLDKVKNYWNEEMVETPEEEAFRKLDNIG